jgi:outer membrane protein assembly factor BamB
MSEHGIPHEPPADPALDQLLTRVLGSARLAPHQRRAHLQHLGLIPSSSNTLDQLPAPTLPDDMGRGHLVEFEMAPVGPWRRRLELGAVAAVLVLVAAVFAGVFRDEGDDREEVVAPITAASPVASPVAITGAERLYVVSHVLTRDRDIVRTSGRVAALDTVGATELWHVDVGPRIDVVLSPDGTRLYVASSEVERGGDNLVALDAATGRELWRVAIEDRTWWTFGEGPSALSVSADGSLLYLYSCSACTGMTRMADGGEHWYQVLDTVDGSPAGTVPAPTCTGPTWAATAGIALYLLCEDDVPQHGTASGGQWSGASFLGTRPADGSVATRDGARVYMVAGNQVTPINVVTPGNLPGRDAEAAVALQPDVTLSLRAQPGGAGFPWLRMLAVSADGSRLFVGIIDERGLREEETLRPGAIAVYDTRTWQELGRILPPEQQLNGYGMAAAGNDTVYAVRRVAVPDAFPVVTSTIMRLGLAAPPADFATRAGEEVLRLISGPAVAASIPRPTPEPTGAGVLFTISRGIPDAGNQLDGWVTAYDERSGATLYQVSTGANVDAVLSPDGTRLYVLGSTQDGVANELIAVQALTGEELWRATVQEPVRYVSSEGPSVLAVAPDDSAVYIYSPGEEGSGQNRVQVVSTRSARGVRQIATIHGAPVCPAQLHPAPDGRRLYVVCLGLGPDHAIFDLETLQPLDTLPASGTLVGTAVTANGELLYQIVEQDGLYEYSLTDLTSGAVTDRGSLALLGQHPLRSLQLVALSPDGTKLFVGMGEEPPDGEPSAGQVWVWDTPLPSGGSIHLSASQAITGATLAPGLDNRSVFAARNVREGASALPRESLVLRLSLDDGTTTFLTRQDEEILRLFTGVVQPEDDLSAILQPTPPVTRDELLRRALILPRLLPGNSCPYSNVRPVFDGFGPLAGIGPVYAGGMDEAGVLQYQPGAYVPVTWVVDRSYTGPVLVRGGRIDQQGGLRFSSFGIDDNPTGSESLSGPTGGSATPGLRHWTTYLGFDSPGCYMLQFDGADFTRTVVFEVVARAATPVTENPWQGQLYALAGGRLLELDAVSGAVASEVRTTPWGSNPSLAVSPAGDRLALVAVLADGQGGVLVYDTRTWTVVQALPVPRLVQDPGASARIAFSADGSDLHLVQSEVSPDGVGDDARYWVGTFDLDAGRWQQDVELAGCTGVAQMTAAWPDRLYVLCAGLVHAIELGGDPAVVRSFGHDEQDVAFVVRGGDLIGVSPRRIVTVQSLDQGGTAPRILDGAELSLSQSAVPSLPVGLDPTGRSLFVPTQTGAGIWGYADNSPASQIAVIDLETGALVRDVLSQATPFADILFAPDGRTAYVTTYSTTPNQLPVLSRVDLESGLVTPLFEGWLGQVVVGGG